VPNHPSEESTPDAPHAFKFETAIPIGYTNTKVTTTAAKAIRGALRKLVPKAQHDQNN
jgi:hypothetical protein